MLILLFFVKVAAVVRNPLLDVYRLFLPVSLAFFFSRLKMSGKMS